MAQWRRPEFTVLALLALFALVMPSLTWACPVTGRIGPAATVCKSSVNGSLPSDVMPCCRQMKGRTTAECFTKCCKSVPQLPGSDTNKSAALTQSHGDMSSILNHLANAAHAVLITFALPTAPPTIEPPQATTCDDVSVTPLLSQYAPSALAGRAPPLS